MKKLVITGICMIFLVCGYSQESMNDYNSLPVVITLQFHSFSMPFQKIGHHFKNVGIGIGTEISHNGNDDQWAQSINVVWYRNRTMGNGIQLYSQAIYRPKVVDDSFGEAKLGIGYSYIFRPVDSYRHKEGNWVNVGKKGKGMLMIPINAGFGIQSSTDPLTTHSINYQWMVLKGYNQSIPIVPNSTIILNSRIYF